jgi:hypothetical protein
MQVAVFAASHEAVTRLFAKMLVIIVTQPAERLARAMLDDLVAGDRRK